MVATTPAGGMIGRSVIVIPVAIELFRLVSFRLRLAVVGDDEGDEPQADDGLGGRQ